MLVVFATVLVAVLSCHFIGSRAATECLLGQLYQGSDTFNCLHFQEYESYHYVKFNRPPKVIKRTPTSGKSWKKAANIMRSTVQGAENTPKHEGGPPDFFLPEMGPFSNLENKN